MNARLPIAALGGFALTCAVPALAQTTPAQPDPGAMQSAPSSAPAPDASAPAPADPSAGATSADAAAAASTDATPKKHKKKHKATSSMAAPQ